MAYFDRNGLKIFYEIKGDPNGKETVVFLNGVMASTSSWELQVPIFEKFGFKIVLFDFINQMLSDKFNGFYAFEQHCEDLKALLEHIGIKKKAHLIGTSLGGEIGMVFATMFPNKVKSLSIIDSVSELDPIMESFIQLWKNLAQKKHAADFFWGMVPTIYGKTFVTEKIQLLKERAFLLGQIPSSYFDGQVQLYEDYLKSFPITKKIRKIKCPALVVCGENDLLKPPKFSKIIAKNIARSEYVVIPDCGHVTIFEKPNILNSLLLGFVLKNS